MAGLASSPCTLGRRDDPDTRRAWDDEHTFPAPLVVDGLGVDGCKSGAAGTHAAHVSQRLLLPWAGGEHLVSLKVRHQITPTVRNWIRPRRLMSRRLHSSQTTSMSTRSIPSTCKSRSRTSSWIISMAGQPMQV